MRSTVHVVTESQFHEWIKSQMASSSSSSTTSGATG
jgi:heme/copper-type cytochrome/quinol oxidase subunit 2